MRRAGFRGQRWRSKDADRERPPFGDDAVARVASNVRKKLGPLRRLETRAGVGTVAAIALLAFAIHHFGGDSVGYDWLNEGRPFARGDAAQVVAALKAAEIPCEERNGKVSVPGGRKSEAIALLSRAKLGPRPIDDLLDEAAKSGSIWDGPESRERQERRTMGKAAGEIIAKMPGVVSATVIFNPVQSGTRLNPKRRLKVTALVQTENGQALGHKTIEMIRNVLTSWLDVDPTAVTLFDPSTGREYLVAGRPEIEAQSTVRVREEELCNSILDQLRIEGARVVVRIDPAADPVATRTIQPVSTTPRLNQPLGEIISEPMPEPAVTGEPSQIGKATVLVRIPRGHYLRLYREHHPTQNPGAEDLAPYAAPSAKPSAKSLQRSCRPANSASSRSTASTTSARASHGTADSP